MVLAILGYSNRRIFKKENDESPAALMLDALDENLVLFLEAASRDQALDALVSELDRQNRLCGGVNQFRQAILERERIVSTGIGFGVAIPHAKLKEYPDFFVAIGIQRGPGLEWKSLDKAPVQLIFLIGGPDERQTQYLKILSALTLAVRDEERRHALLRATSPQEVIALLSTKVMEYLSGFNSN